MNDWSTFCKCSGSIGFCWSCFRWFCCNSNIFFLFIPTWGNDPIWLIFCKMGWNHQTRGDFVVNSTGWFLFIMNHQHPREFVMFLFSIFAAETNCKNRARIWRLCCWFPLLLGGCVRIQPFWQGSWLPAVLLQWRLVKAWTVPLICGLLLLMHAYLHTTGPQNHDN